MYECSRQWLLFRKMLSVQNRTRACNGLIWLYIRSRPVFLNLIETAARQIIYKTRARYQQIYS